MKTKNLLIAFMLLCSVVFLGQLTSFSKDSSTTQTATPDPTPSSVSLAGTVWIYSNDTWIGSYQHYSTNEIIRFLDSSNVHIDFEQVATIYDPYGDDPEIITHEDSGDCEYSCSDGSGTMCGYDFTYNDSYINYRGHKYYKTH